MSEITVRNLKNKLENVLSQLDDLEDDQKINLVSNTYFLGHPRLFLGIAGYEGGYLALDCIEDSLADKDDDDYEEEE
jgi:hypothetical protein